MKLFEVEGLVNQSPEMTTDTNNTEKDNEGVEIKPTDVLCGRGKRAFEHSGNRRFRSIVDGVLPAYINAASRTEKSEIVTSIVNQVREAGGRFLKRDGKRGVWYVLNYSQSKEKAGHAIRDATITEESKKERAKKRKLQRAAAAKKSRQQSQDKDNESVSSSSSTSSSLVVTPEKNEHQCQQNIYSKYDPEPVGSTRDISIKSALSATLKQRQHFPPLDISSSSMDMTPIPLDQPSLSGETFNLLEDAFLGLDPFMDYIDEVLGPSPSF